MFGDIITGLTGGLYSSQQLWDAVKDKEDWYPIEKKRRLEAEAERLRDFHAAERASGGRPRTYSRFNPVDPAEQQRQDMHRFRRAAAPLSQDVQAKLKTGGYDPYTVQVGPAARAFPTMPSM